ncbi:MAG: flagellar hook-basal body complex protein FliE [Pseudomonadota bacterium]
MDIKAFSAAKSYAASRPATDPADVAASPAQSLKTAGLDFAATLRESEMAAKGAMVGTVDPHTLVQAMAQTELAVETAVTVRDKVVEAYQEILRMPV